MITIEQVSKTYSSGGGAVHANSEIDLQIAKGEFVVLAGPSGSGKTTLLNLIGGLDSPTAGTITVAGTEITALTQKRLVAYRRDQVGFIFQRSNLVSSLSVYENATIQLRLQHRLTASAKQRTTALLDQVGLGDKHKALPSQLSGGQQQRAAIVRAVVAEPAIVIADEPTASLDSENAEEVLAILRELNTQADITVVVSSHDPRVIAAGRRVVTLVDGRITKDEPR